jgi:hypothetical protein
MQQQGGQVIDRDRIEATLKEIGAVYRPGLIGWLKEDRGRWRRLLDLEDAINKAALAQDEAGLTMILTKYQSFFREMVSVFTNGG